MSGEAITDAAVRHFAENVAGIKGAYASGAGGQGASVRTIPSDISDAPVAVLEVTSLRYEIEPGSFERTRWTFDVVVWFSAADAADAAFVALPFLTRIRDSFRSNADLYGTARWAVATGVGPMSPEEVNGKPFLALPVHITALEYEAAPYTRVGP